MTDDALTRDEMNRLWAELRALQLLVSMDVAQRWDVARVEKWFDRISERLDAGGAPDEGSLAHTQRALGELAAAVKHAMPSDAPD